ncbi:SPOCS domain-containing protein [Paraclostridium dentum]|uniref:SPOCS domain-containing protein n=1 Tax=Paraclostridium dentum TaxID=2662455 RepID=UPI003F3725D8
MEILQAFKSANQSYVFITNNIQFLTYTIIINNISNGLASDVILTDIIPYGACFQTNTFSVNGEIIEDADPNIGVNIGNINANSSVVITFDVIIDPVNPPSELQNYASISYLDCSNTLEQVTIITNAVRTPIISVCVEVLKSVNKCSVQLNDILNYRLIVKNNSTVTLNNAVLYDSIPQELTVLPGSVYVNGVKTRVVDFSQGLPLGDIPPYKIIIVLFQAIVDCLPCFTSIDNQAYLLFDYSFQVDNDFYSSNGNASSNVVSTKAGPESFKQIILDSTLKLPCKNKGDIEIVDTFLEVEITRQEIIETIKGKSCEGEILTGSKLVVDGTLHERIEYIELCSDQSVHVAEYNIPFNTFIVLPPNCDIYNDVIVESTIENFDVKVLCNGNIYQNLALLLKVIY